MAVGAEQIFLLFRQQQPLGAGFRKRRKTPCLPDPLSAQIQRNFPSVNALGAAGCTFSAEKAVVGKLRMPGKGLQIQLVFF